MCTPLKKFLNECLLESERVSTWGGRCATFKHPTANFPPNWVVFLSFFCVCVFLPILGWFERQEGKAPRGVCLGSTLFLTPNSYGQGWPQELLASRPFNLRSGYMRRAQDVPLVGQWYKEPLIEKVGNGVVGILPGKIYLCMLMDGKHCLPYLRCANICSQHMLAAVRCKLAQLVFLG